MKKLYRVTVYGDSKSTFKEHYTEEEIDIINKFFNDMDKHGVAAYDIPSIEIEEITVAECNRYTLHGVVNE